MTAPLVVAGLLCVGLPVLAGCGGGQAAGATLPAGGPTRGRGGMQEASPGTSAGSAPAPSGISGQQYLQAAREAFASAPSVHVTGTAVRGADAYVVDAHVAGASGGTATVTTSGQTVTVTRIGDDAWVGGDLAFWKAVTGDPARARAMAGKAVRTRATGGDFDPFTAFTLPGTYAAVLPDPAHPATVGATTTIGGAGAIAVRDEAGSTLYVATTGPAYPLRLDGLASGQVVFLDLGDYGRPVQLTAPPTAQVTGSGLGS